MKHYMKQGWRLTTKHVHILIVLFLYQLLCEFFLYRFIDSVVSPLLRRYPGNLPSDYASGLFWAEAEFRLLKTDLIQPYLWTLLIIFIIRLIISPLLNAGLYYSLHQVSLDAEEGSRFMQGIRHKWKPMILLQWGETLLALAPAFWLLPRALDTLLSGSSSQQLIMTMLPWAAGWMLWIFILYIISRCLQFGAVSGLGLVSSLKYTWRGLLPMIMLTITIWVIAGISGCLVSGVELFWAGMFALVLHQAYCLVRTLFKVWTAASQYESWTSRQSSP